MTSDYLKTKIGGVILSLAVLFGIGLAASITAQAQYPYPQYPQYPQYPNGQTRRDRDQDRDRDWNRNRDYRNGRGYGNYAFDQGYQAGLYTGQSDAQRNQNYNPQRSHYYRSGNNGNSSSYGRDKQAFREGFLRGYDEGYRRYGGRNRRGGGLGRWFPY